MLGCISGEGAADPGLFRQARLILHNFGNSGKRLEQVIKIQAYIKNLPHI